MQVDELIGSLQTFELTLNDRPDKKNKSIEFMSNTEEEDEESKWILLENSQKLWLY